MNEYEMYFDGTVKLVPYTTRVVETTAETQSENTTALTANPSDANTNEVRETESHLNYYTAVLAIVLAIFAIAFPVIQTLVHQGNNCLGVHSKCSQKDKQTKRTTYFIFSNVIKNSVVLGSDKKSHTPLVISYDKSLKGVTIENAQVCSSENHIFADEKLEKKNFSKPTVKYTEKYVGINFKRLAYDDYFVIKIEHQGDLSKNARIICNIFNCKAPYINKINRTIVNILTITFALILFVMAAVLYIFNYDVFRGTITTVLFTMYVGLWIFFRKNSVNKAMRDKLKRIIREDTNTI